MKPFDDIYVLKNRSGTWSLGRRGLLESAGLKVCEFETDSESEFELRLAAMGLRIDPGSRWEGSSGTFYEVCPL